MFFGEIYEKHDIEQAIFLIDVADHPQVALSRLRPRFHIRRHRNRNLVEYIFYDIKKINLTIFLCFSNAEPTTAES